MERPYFFVHLMKTAGYAFVLHLHREFSPEAFYPYGKIDVTDLHDFDAYVNVSRLLQLDAARRASIRIYTGHMPYVTCRLMDPRPVTLTLLRDPVERTVSQLKHLKRGLPTAKDMRAADTTLTRRYADMPLEAIYDDELAFKVFIEDYQAKAFAIDPADDVRRAFPFGDTLHYLYGSELGDDVSPPDLACAVTIDPDRLALAKANLAQVDVVGIAERFDAFVSELRSQFGWWPKGLDASARANVSREDWEVPASFRRRIADDNAYELEFYEFARELTAERR